MTANESTLNFIREHRNDDVRSVAFIRAEGVDMPFALEQIAGYQKARKKLPRWSKVEGLVYPPSLSMEQCSSERTAEYKVSLLRGKKGRMADLTGGFGVDFSYLAQNFEEAVYVERQEKLCRIAEHNFRLLGLNHARVVCDDCESFLKQMPQMDVIYLDPARRDDRGGRTFAISDCTPDIVALLPQLLEKAETIMVKLSPMLDWHKAVVDFGGHVTEVHIVAVDNECKELLLLIGREITDSLRIVCRNNDSEFAYIDKPTNALYNNIIMCKDSAHAPSACMPSADYWLLVPNVAVMKAGCFGQIREVFGIAPLSANSHLFVSPVPVEGFPGSAFRIECVTTMNKKELRTALNGITRANIAVRNFPISAADLRKRLKMQDGGNVFIFATTLHDNSHVLIICRRD
ncbi:MAG: SAM-dependent methyltransferase [Prevotella sp.]|nr:SAM-dependent methyltransferase [Prevotella sp.]